MSGSLDGIIYSNDVTVTSGDGSGDGSGDSTGGDPTGGDGSLGGSGFSPKSVPTALGAGTPLTLASNVYPASISDPTTGSVYYSTVIGIIPADEIGSQTETIDTGTPAELLTQ